MRRKVLSWLECVDLSHDCGAAGESKLEQSANRPGLNLDKDCNNLGDLKKVSASSLNVASKFLSNHKSCKSDKSCEDSDAVSSVGSRCSSKSKESRKKFKWAKLSFKLAEEQSYDEGRVAELEARLKSEKLAAKAREAKRKMMFAEAESRAFEDDLSDCSSSKSDISKIPNNIAEVLPELEPSKDICAPSKMLGTNKIASKKFPSNLSDPFNSKIKETSAEQRMQFGIFDITHPAEIEPVLTTQPSESRVPVTNRPPEMGIFTNWLSEQYADTLAVYSQVGKQNSAVAQSNHVTKEKIIVNQYPTVVDRLHAPDVAGMSAVTRFFEPNCSSDIARTVADVGQASHPSGIPHLPPHEVSGTRGPYPPMLPSLVDYERNPTESLYPPGVPQFSRPSYNNTRNTYPPGNIFVPNNVNRNSGRAATSNLEKRPVNVVSRKSKDSKSDLVCVCCDEAHELSECSEFQQKNHQERKKFVFDKKLCLKCLQSGHFAKDCRSTSVCKNEGSSKKYGATDHKLLQRPEKMQNDVCAATICGTTMTRYESHSDSESKKEESKTYLDILPVRVRCNGVEALTYELLDSGSFLSFCSRRLINALNAIESGTPTKTSLETLTTDTPTSFDTSCFDFDVLPLDDKGKFKMSKVTMIDSIPVNLSSRNVVKRLDKFDHLHGVDLPAVNGSTVTLLIGNVNALLHFPIETRAALDPSKDPQAIKTPLGWILKGPNNPGENDTKQFIYLLLSGYRVP